jgi:hypothetical protein
VPKLVDALERREYERARRETRCELFVGGRWHEGVARDVSLNGLFVKSAVKVGRGVLLRVRLHPPDGAPIELLATAPHQRVLPRSLDAIDSGGVGLNVRNAPDDYGRFVEAETEAA